MLPRYHAFDSIVENIEGPTLNANIVKCKNNPGILTNQTKYESKNKLQKDIKKVFFRLKPKKVCQIFDTLTKIIKENVEIFADFLCTSINKSFKFSLFPLCVKFEDATVQERKKRCETKLHRPVSILPTLSKRFSLLGQAYFLAKSRK